MTTERLIRLLLLLVLLLGVRLLRASDFTTRSSAQTSESLVNVSAASFRRAPLAPDSIVSAFGARLANTTEVAQGTPLPTELAGTRVAVKDSAGVERFAPLFFVSPGQINYQMPTGTAPGTTVVRVLYNDATVGSESLANTPVAPGLFAANASGKDAAAALALRVTADGAQRFEPVVRYDPFDRRFLPLPIEFASDANSSEQVFLILYATGLRQRSSLTNVTVRLGGVEAPVIFAGAQGDLAGLDQVNVRLPRSLIGRGKIAVELTVDGQAANPVQISVAAPAAYFQFNIPPRTEIFTFKLLDPELIQHARALLAGTRQDLPHVIGTIVKAPAPYNRPWSYHFDPATISFFDLAVEVCDGNIQYVEDHLDEAGGHFLPGNRWCPWNSRLVREVPPPQ
jgi:uncharacterized protein (TIGR03437 family)